MSAGRPTPPSPEPLRRGYLPHLLSRLMNLLNRELMDHLRPVELTTPQFRVMQVLAGWDGATINEIARDTVLEQSVVSRIAAQLEERGLATRRKKAQNQRYVGVSLTEAGRQLFESVDAQAKAITAAALSDLSDPEREQLLGLLQRVFDRVARPANARPVPSD